MEFHTASDFTDGKIILLDKELNWTSFDLVNKLRIALRSEFGIRKIKVGHTGTLDPLASGLVILCSGKATKQIDSFMGLDKEYVAEFTLGATTPSYDLETEIDNTFPYDHISKELIEQVLSSCIGESEQIPPIFSAKQIDGKRAYDLARRGEEVILKANLIQIHELELLSWEAPKLVVRISCSKGTYIRALARDIGKKLNSGAYLSGLRRTKIGNYHVNDAEIISDFLKKLKPL